MKERRQEFSTPEEQSAGDAKGLVAKAAKLSALSGKPVHPVSLIQRRTDFEEGKLESLKEAIVREQEAVNAAIVIAAETEKASRILTPEEKEIALQTLAARFQVNEYLHKGIEWSRVKASLEANPEALWSINEMEKAGHEPDVYNSDEKGFDIGTCSKESPASGRNCVYDEEVAEWIKTSRPNEKFNGNAVGMAKAMGIDLMDPTLYKNVLQNKGKFDKRTWSWLKTKLVIRSTGFALDGSRYDDGVGVLQDSIHYHDENRSWRGSLRVEWAA